MPTEFRPATINEAVESILRCFTKAERIRQLAWFREKHGDGYADEVKRLVEAKFKKRK